MFAMFSSTGPIASFFLGPYIRGYVLDQAIKSDSGGVLLGDWKAKEVQKGIRGFGDRWRVGMGSFLISFIYSIPSLLIIFLFGPRIGSFFVSISVLNENSTYKLVRYFLDNQTYSLVESTIPLLILIFFVTIAIYIIPLAQLEWAKTQKFKRAFSWKSLLLINNNKRYLLARLLTLLTTFSLWVAVRHFAPESYFLLGHVDQPTIASLIITIASMFIIGLINFIVQIFNYTLIAKSIK